MLEVKKYPLLCSYSVAKFPKHDLIKSRLFEYLDAAETSSLSSTECVDNIHFLDWELNEDFDRPWVKFFLSEFQSTLDQLAVANGFISAKILQIWFQRYVQSNAHGWHTHSCNFTGVYYLALPPEGPKTQLIEPALQNKIIVPDVEEGDILIFPSHTIHQAPTILTDTTKTIISFNFDFKHMTETCMASIFAASMVCDSNARQE